MSNAHSLTYKYVPQERRRLVRHIHALMAKRQRAKSCVARSLVHKRTLVYDVTIRDLQTGEVVANQWEARPAEESEQ